MERNHNKYDIFQAEREALLTELHTGGIQNEAVIETLRKIPRHLFLDKEFSNFAYENRALPIGHEQTISQPYIVAYMTQVLLEGGMPKKILEVGTGSGYQTAVLASLVTSVFTIERIMSLHNRARRLLRKLDFHNIHFRRADGSRGWQQYAPFDGIIVTAAAREIFPVLTDQLAVGGRLIAPIGEGDTQHLVLIDRTNHHLKKKTLQAVKFVPLIS